MWRRLFCLFFWWRWKFNLPTKFSKHKRELLCTLMIWSWLNIVSNWNEYYHWISREIRKIEKNRCIKRPSQIYFRLKLISYSLQLANSYEYYRVPIHKQMFLIRLNVSWIPNPNMSELPFMAVISQFVYWLNNPFYSSTTPRFFCLTCLPVHKSCLLCGKVLLPSAIVEL